MRDKITKQMDSNDCHWTHDRANKCKRERVLDDKAPCTLDSSSGSPRVGHRDESPSDTQPMHRKKRSERDLNKFGVPDLGGAQNGRIEAQATVSAFRLPVPGSSAQLAKAFFRAFR